MFKILNLELPQRGNVKQSYRLLFDSSTAFWFLVSISVD